MNNFFLKRMIVAVAMIAIILVACNKRETSEVVVPATEREALIVFLTGDVQIRRSTGDDWANIGDTLSSGERLITGANSYAELKIGEMGSVRINADTEYSLDSLSISEKQTHASGTLLAGSIASKIKKLSGNDSFDVNVPGAVCAVRGTEFLVRADEYGSLTVAVNEGSVYIAPPSLANNNTSELAEIRSIMPLVGVGEQLVFSEDSFQEMDRKVQEFLTDASSDATKAAEFTESLTTILASIPTVTVIDADIADELKETTATMLSTSLETGASTEMVSLTVETEPANAEIVLNDQTVGIGMISRLYPRGEPINIQAITEDGRTQSTQIVAGEQAVVEIIFETLSEVEKPQTTEEPKLIVNRVKLPSPGIGTPASDGRNTVIATKGGDLVALNRYGEPLWIGKTENRDGDNTSPTIIGNRLYSIGNTELAVLDMSNGRMLSQIALEGGQKDLFGRRIVPYGSQALLPGDVSLEILDLVTGSVQESIDIDQGSRSTPSVWKDRILLPNQRGSLLIINSNLEVEHTIETSSLQPIAQAPTVVNNRAFFVGRQGTVSAVDLNNPSLLWERTLVTDDTVKIYSDMVANTDTIFAYGEGLLFALRIGDGKDQFMPISRVSAPPLLVGSFLYVPRENMTMTIHNPKTGTVIGTVPISETVYARPAVLGDFVVLAGQKEAVIIDPRSITN